MLSQALLFLLLLNDVLGQTLTITAGVSTSTRVKCSTKFAEKSVRPPLPTSTVTRTALPDVRVIISASTPVATVTPKPVTTTTTQTIPTTVTTTLAGMTGVFSTTSTFTSTNTITVFSTAFTTVTSTSSTTTTVTSEVAPPPGFITVEQSSGDRDAPPGKARRDDRTLSPKGAVSKRFPQFLDLLFPTRDMKYPVAISCIKTIQVVIIKKLVTIKHTSTKTLPASTSTVTSTTRPTVTATAVGSAVTSTVSFQTTTTVDSTTTSVTTSTATTTTTIIESSTLSSYRACATDNQLGPNLADGRISTIFAGSERDLFFSTEVPEATNPYECCVACLLNPAGCYASSYFERFDIPCNIFERRDDSKTCDNPGFVAGRYDRSSNPNVFNRATYSNGPCGVVQQGPDVE
ncbi:MAG: hypothetical protein Q9215_004103 [Flavoplaca cf. flavocitrina]